MTSAIPTQMPDFSSLLKPVIHTGSEIRRMQHVLKEQRTPEPADKATLNILQREIEPQLFRIISLAQPGAFGHDLMPTILIMILRQNPAGDLCSAASAALARIRKLSTDGEEFLFVQTFRDGNGYNHHTDLITVGRLNSKALSAQISHEYPYQVSELKLSCRRMIQRGVMRDDRNESAGTVSVAPKDPEFEIVMTPEYAHADDRMTKFMEAIAGSMRTDRTRLYVGKDEITAFLESDYMKKHPRSLQIINFFRHQTDTA